MLSAWPLKLQEVLEREGLGIFGTRLTAFEAAAAISQEEMPKATRQLATATVGSDFRHSKKGSVPLTAVAFKQMLHPPGLPGSIQGALCLPRASQSTMRPKLKSGAQTTRSPSPRPCSHQRLPTCTGLSPHPRAWVQGQEM